MKTSLVMIFIGELSHGKIGPLNITEVICDTSRGQALITWITAGNEQVWFPETTVD